MSQLGGFRSYSGRLEEDRIPGVSRPSISGEIVFTERKEGLTASPPFRIPCYVGRKTGEAIAPRPCLRFSRTLDPMMNASDKGYNEGRLAFRRYFAKVWSEREAERSEDAAQSVRGILRGPVAQRVRV